jgi:branched-chain amino acid aminotransferase
MQNALVNVNGKISSVNDAEVSVFDRGFLYGDSLYEVARSYDGVFFYLDEHLERLEASAKLCDMTLGQTTAQYRREIYDTFETFRKQPGMAKAEAYCRIIVTRGVGRIGFGLNCLQTPSQYVILMLPVDDFVPTREKFQKGMKLKVSCRLRNDRRALDPAMKSGNYLNSLLAFLEVSREGYDDALLCNADGHMTEGTTFNIFYVRKGIIATPPLDVGILDGITRRHVIQMARGAGFPVREVRFPSERLHEADEVFATSSLKEVFPVTQIDHVKIKGGKPGPITLRLHEVFQTMIAKEIAKGRDVKRAS